MVEERNLWQEDETAKDLKFYFATIRRPLLVSAGAILFFYLLSLVSFLSWTREVLGYATWLISLALILVVVWRTTNKRFKEGLHGATVGFLAGLLIGWWQVVLETIWFWSWWRLLDLVVEPLVIALVGALIGVVAAKILQIKNKTVTLAATEPAAIAEDKKEKPYGEEQNNDTQN